MAYYWPNWERREIVQEITAHFLKTGLWSSHLDKYTVHSFTEETYQKARKQCGEFYDKIKDIEGINTIKAGQVGQYFWLCRHSGSRFKDAGLPELDKIAKEFGHCRVFESGNNRHVRYEG